MATAMDTTDRELLLMRRECPYCGKTARHAGKRFLYGDSARDKYHTARTDLYLMQCAACKKQHLLYRHIPIDKTIDVIEQYSNSLSDWHTALHKKPGVVFMGIVVTDYTKMISFAGPEVAFKKHLVYDKVSTYLHPKAIQQRQQKVA